MQAGYADRWLLPLETSRPGYVMVSLSNLDPRWRPSSWGLVLRMPDRKLRFIRLAFGAETPAAVRAGNGPAS